MTGFSRKWAFSAATLCLMFALGATPAEAKTHTVCHCVKTKISSKAKVSSAKTVTRIAQQHLANLGYYDGKIDGVMGAQTKAAIKKFQHDKKLAADGVLGRKTIAALAAADGGSRPYASTVPARVIGRHSMPMTLTRRDIMSRSGNGLGVTVIGEDAPVNPDYATSMGETTKTASSRFARVEISEVGTGSEKRYNVALNGQVIMLVEGQPSVIGVSQTYDLGNEDAIIFTSYSPDASGCMYKTHVLTMTSASNQLLPLTNCTRDFQAQVTNGSLYVVFPESDDGRTVGATWRVEGSTAERL